MTNQPATFSGDFLADIAKRYDTFTREIRDLEKKHHQIIDDRVVEEELRLEELLISPVAVGTKVWCGTYKRHGTVIEAEVEIFTSGDDYYAPTSGPGSLGPPRASWQYTVQPDPSPVRGNIVAPYTVLEVQLEKNGGFIGHSSFGVTKEIARKFEDTLGYDPYDYDE